MANEKETSEYPERLLGRMLVEAARVRAGEVPEDSRPSDETVLKLYELLSDSSTGTTERAEAISMLMRDPEAYARWLSLNRFMDRHARDEPLQHASVKTSPIQRRRSGKVRESLGQKLQRMLSGFWYNPALSAAFGLALGILVTTLYSSTPELAGHGDHEPTLAQQGVPLPNKANLDTFTESGPAPTASTQQLSQSIRCVETSDMLRGRLCYTATTPDQQWFQISDVDQVRALAPPVETQRIIDVRSVGDLLLVEHQRGEEYRISLLRLNEESNGLRAEPLYEDSAVEGYFDEVVLDEDGLKYTVHRGKEMTERHFAIP